MRQVSVGRGRCGVAARLVACVALALALALALGTACARAARFDIIDLPNGDRAVLLTGPIGMGDEKAFHATAAKLDGHVVVTTGPGGNVHAAVSIGNEIRARGWSTLVPPNTDCASACALIWLSGDLRMMAEGARIGFHALSVRKNGVYMETHDRDVDLHRWLTDLGYTEDTTATIVNTPAALVRWLDPIELRANGIAVDQYP